MELKELKNIYQIYEKKYKLPTFSKLNDQFEIEKIEKESEFMLRAIRKTMMDKIVNSLTFIEMIINPVNASRIYLPFIKSITPKDKENIDLLYDAFGELSLECLPLELESSEKKEAEMIKKIFSQWEKLRPKFSELLRKVYKPVNGESKKEKSYYG